MQLLRVPDQGAKCIIMPYSYHNDPRAGNRRHGTTKAIRPVSETLGDVYDPDRKIAAAVLGTGTGTRKKKKQDSPLLFILA